MLSVLLSQIVDQEGDPERAEDEQVYDLNPRVPVLHGL